MTEHKINYSIVSGKVILIKVDTLTRGEYKRIKDILERNPINDIDIKIPFKQ